MTRLELLRIYVSGDALLEIRRKITTSRQFILVRAAARELRVLI